MLIKGPMGSEGVFSCYKGAVRFERLQPGTYRIQVCDSRGNKVPEQTVELTADREVVIDLPSPPPP